MFYKVKLWISEDSIRNDKINKYQHAPIAQKDKRTADILVINNNIKLIFETSL